MVDEEVALLRRRCLKRVSPKSLFKKGLLWVKSVVEPYYSTANDLLIHRVAVPLLRWRRLIDKSKFERKTKCRHTILTKSFTTY